MEQQFKEMMHYATLAPSDPISTLGKLPLKTISF